MGKDMAMPTPTRSVRHRFQYVHEHDAPDDDSFLRFKGLGPKL